mgnify:FL=1
MSTPDSSMNPPDRTARGIVLIVLSVLAMAFADAVVKLVSGDLTVWQVFAIRSAVALPILLLLARVTGAGLRVKAAGWVMLRSLLLVLTWLAFYAALPVLDLSVAAVAVYSNPVITTLMAAMLAGDRVTERQWVGVGLGFLGVIAILRPGTEAFAPATLLPLLAALFYSTAMVLTRVKCQDEPPMALGLAVHAAFLIAGGVAIVALAAIAPGADLVDTNPFLLRGWAGMTGADWGAMVLLGVLSAGYFVGVARAYQIAPAPIIATFDYFYLVSAAIWGFLFFAESPDLFTWLGMALITGAGLLVAKR